MSDNPLVVELARRSGLSPIFATDAIRRALARAGVDPAQASADDLSAAMPEIERVIAVFLAESQRATALASMRALLTAKG